MGLKSKIFILAAALCMLTKVGYSQNLMERFDGIKFIINGSESMSPFNGGMDNAILQFIDIDGDGKKDLFTFDQDTTLYFYKNTGTSQNAAFTLMSKKFLNLNLRNWFHFVDIDNDNDYDLFGGGEGQTIRFYKNNGSTTSPQFVLEVAQLKTNTDTAIITDQGPPSLMDMDNDGDKDLLLGNFLIGKTQFYRNTGTAQNFNFQFESMANQIGIDSLGQSSAPVFVDIDNDNDYDLFAGDWNGRIHYYENTGNASNFNFQFRSKFYNGIDVGDESIPRFYDIDGDNDFDLFIGRRDGKISYYRNEGNATNPNFVLQTDNYKNINTGRNSNPEFVDIDNDTDGDLFVGNIKGGFYFYENRDVIGIQTISSNVPDGFLLKQNYPNPFNPTTNIAFDLPKPGFVELSVYDITGKLIQNLLSQQLSPGSYNYDWDAAELSSGVYFYTLKAGDFVSTKKMLLLK